MIKMRIERIPVGELYEFALNAQSDKEHYNVLPITSIRALSHCKNPAASEDDVGLLVAYADDKCIGYLGILPCRLFREGKLLKVYALSTFFVDESYRGKLVASMIMADAIALKYDFFLAGFTTAAEKFYRRNTQWFEQAASLPYLRIHLLPQSSALYWLGNRFKPMRGLFNSFFSLNRYIANVGGWRFLYRFLEPLASNLCMQTEARQVSEVHPPKEKYGCVSDTCCSYFHRGSDTVNWKIRYPWITEDQTDKSDILRRYSFSYWRALFRFLPFELSMKQSGEHLGYVVFSISTIDGLVFLKILDYELNNEAYLPCILDLALREASHWKADIIEGSRRFWHFIQPHLPLRMITEHKERRNYLHSSSNESMFGGHAQEIHFDFNDGDRGFF